MFCVDSKPVPVCRIARTKRCRLGKYDFAKAPSFGYCATQDCYYYGYKLHALCGLRGVIHSYDLSKASVHDTCKTSNMSTTDAPSSATKDTWVRPYNWTCSRHPRSDWKYLTVWIKRIGNQLLLPSPRQGNVWKRFSHRWLTNLCFVAIMRNNK